MRYFLLSLLFAPLAAEIVSVDLTWNKSLCDEGCNKLIERRYRQVAEIEDFTIGQGYMNIKWKPEAPFNYLMVRRPMQRVGVHIQGIAVTANGRVKREGDKFYLVSTPDGTTFELTSPPAPKTGAGYTSYSNLNLYHLIPQLQEELIEVIKNKGTIQASGYLLMPWRRELILIVGNYSVQAPPEEEKPPLRKREPKGLPESQEEELKMQKSSETPLRRREQKGLPETQIEGLKTQKSSENP